MAGLGEGMLERVFVVTALALWVLLSGCASAPTDEAATAPATPGTVTASAELDCTLLEAGAFFIPAPARRAGWSIADRIRDLGYDGSRDVRRRTRLVNEDGYTREVVEGWEGIGLRYRDPACRHGVGGRSSPGD
jgi:hypothetical protein